MLCERAVPADITHQLRLLLLLPCAARFFPLLYAQGSRQYPTCRTKFIHAENHLRYGSPKGPPYNAALHDGNAPHIVSALHLM